MSRAANEAQVPLLARPLKNNQGFVMTLMMALLPALLGILFTVFIGIAFVQFEMRQNYICRAQQLQVQNQVAPLLEGLMNLNPTAKELQMEQQEAEEELASATASLNPAAIAAATAHLVLVEDERAALALQQRQLIEDSNLLLEEGSLKTQRALSDNGWEFLNSLKPILQNELQVLPQIPPVLAVRPEDLDIAPSYELLPDFEDEQALVQEWHYRLSVGRQLSPFLKGQSQFVKSCSVTLRQKGAHWVAQILKDKSSSNSVW